MKSTGLPERRVRPEHETGGGDARRTDLRFISLLLLEIKVKRQGLGMDCYHLAADMTNPEPWPEMPWKIMEPATRIERATCGLRMEVGRFS